MTAEGYDRINVEANPINFIDPYGLFWGEAWELSKSGVILGGSIVGQGLIETMGIMAHIGEIGHGLYTRAMYESGNIPSRKEILDVSISFSVATAAEFGEQGLWGFELAARSLEDGISAAYSCQNKNNDLSNFIQNHRSGMSDYSNLFKNDVSDFIAGRNMANSPFRGARYFYSDLGTELRTSITNTAGDFTANLIIFTKAIMQ